MATEGKQTKVGSAVAFHHVSPLSTGSRPSKEDKHATNLPEAGRSSDRLWLSKQRSCPSLLHRKLSCDSDRGTFLDEHCEDFKFNTKAISTKEKLFAELSTVENIERKAKICRKSSEGSVLLDTTGDDMGEERAKATSSPCSCGMSSFEKSLNSCLCHSPQSSPSPGSGPVQHCNLRRGSLPVSMLAFHKVVQFL